MRLENHFFYNWRQPKLSKKLKIEKTFFRIFFEFFLKSPVSRIVPKNVKGGPSGIFRTSILLQNIKKLNGGPYGAIKKISEKNEKFEQSHSAGKRGKVS